jgi:hypothetical protein
MEDQGLQVLEASLADYRQECLMSSIGVIPIHLSYRQILLVTTMLTSRSLLQWGG